MTQPVQHGKSSRGVVVLIVAIGFILLFSVSSSLWGFLGLRAGAAGRWSPFLFPPMIPLGLMALLQVGLAAWVGVDANRKGLNGYLWGLLVLFTSLAGLIVYLILGPNLTGKVSQPFGGSGIGAEASAATCPICSMAVQMDFKFCPSCGTHLASCRKCEKSIQPEWKVCPYCGTSVEG